MIENSTEEPPANTVSISPRALTLIGRTGWTMFAIWSVVLIVWGIVEPDPYAQGWRLVLELAFLGRLLSVADGVANGFSQMYLFAQSGPQDVILLLVAYPLIVSAYEGSERRGLISRSIDRVRRTAERNKRFVEPFGAIGLWIFVFFPFWSTGALVGGVVGYLLGMRTGLVFASVLSGHIVSVVVLVWFFEFVYDAALAFSEGNARFLPWIVLGVLLLSMIAGRLLKGRDAEDSDAQSE